VVEGLQAESGPGLHQVAGHLGLAVHGHGSADQVLEGQAVSLAIQAQLHAGVNQAFGIQSVRDSQLPQQGNSALLQDAGPDPAEDVVGAAMLQDDVVDASVVQELAQQKSCGTCTD